MSNRNKRNSSPSPRRRRSPHDNIRIPEQEENAYMAPVDNRRLSFSFSNQDEEEMMGYSTPRRPSFNSPSIRRRLSFSRQDDNLSSSSFQDEEMKEYEPSPSYRRRGSSTSLASEFADPDELTIGPMEYPERPIYRPEDNRRRTDLINTLLKTMNSFLSGAVSVVRRIPGGEAAMRRAIDVNVSIFVAAGLDPNSPLVGFLFSISVLYAFNVIYVASSVVNVEYRIFTNTLQRERDTYIEGMLRDTRNFFAGTVIRLTQDQELQARLAATAARQTGIFFVSGMRDGIDNIAQAVGNLFTRIVGQVVETTDEVVLHDEKVPEGQEHGDRVDFITSNGYTDLLQTITGHADMTIGRDLQIFSAIRNIQSFSRITTLTQGEEVMTTYLNGISRSAIYDFENMIDTISDQFNVDFETRELLFPQDDLDILFNQYESHNNRIANVITSRLRSNNERVVDRIYAAGGSIGSLSAIYSLQARPLIGNFLFMFYIFLIISILYKFVLGALNPRRDVWR